MGTSTIGASYNLEVPLATVSSTSSEYITRFNVDLGDYAKLGDIIECQITTSSDTTFSNIVATQIAVADEAGIYNNILDWSGEPPLVNGNYRARFRARRSGVTTDWSSSAITWTVAANYGLDLTAPILTTPTSSSVADNTATVGVTTDEGNGTLYVVVATNSNALDATQIKSGQIENVDGTSRFAPAGSAQNQTISSTGAKTFAVSGLTPGVTHYASFVHTDLAGNDSNIVMSEGFTTTDTAIPVVSGVSGVALTSTTGSGTATTSQPLGTIYWVVTTSSTSPTAAQVKLGQNASGVDAGTGKKGSSSVTTAGTYTFSFSSLTANTTYYTHVMHEDELAQQSLVAKSASWATPVAVDVTAPVLTVPLLTTTSDTTANWSVATDEANGTLYMVLTTVTTKPTAAQIRAGQTNTGATAPYSTSQAITSTGNKTGTATGLTASTGYYAHFTHRDAANNDATVVTSSVATTTATPSGGALGSSIELNLLSPTDQLQPEFSVILNSCAANDVLRLSWSGYATGYDDYTVTSGNVDPSDATFAQFSWSLPSFALQSYTFSVTQTRGGNSVVSNGISLTFGGSSGTVAPPSPPPAAETYNYQTETSDTLIMEDGVSYYLRESAP